MIDGEYKSRIQACCLFGFVTFFFIAMWVSKVLAPLHAEKLGHTLNFGVSYTAMALAGAFSFAYGTLVDRIGVRLSILMGSLLYSFGLALRIFVDSSVLMALSGVFSGIGCSLVLLSFRPWILSWLAGRSTSIGSSLMQLFQSLGTALGAFLTGGLVVSLSGTHNKLLSNINSEFVLPLLYIAGVPLVCSLLAFQLAPGKPLVISARQKIQSKSEPGSKYERVQFSRRLKSLLSSRVAWLVAVVSLSGGFVTGLVVPYLPIVLQKFGLDVTRVGWAVGFFSLLQVAVSWGLSRVLKKSRTHISNFYIVAEFILGLVLALFVFELGIFYFLALLACRSVLIVIAKIAEESYWLEAFPASRSGFLFGILQSAFLAGDGAGGIVGAFMLGHFGPRGVFLLSSIVTILSAALAWGVGFKKTTHEAKSPEVEATS
jgi:MFS family permease